MLEWLMLHWKDLALAATGIVTAASLAIKAIAPLTKNTKDDAVATKLSKFVVLLNTLALNPRSDA